jgi:predicted nicotinamide N-methyase
MIMNLTPFRFYFFVSAKEVVLTDGDPVNLQGLRKSLINNNFRTEAVGTALLRWDCKTVLDGENKFDIVIAADVVYDSCVSEPLLETVSKLLKPSGQFILFNPTRVDRLLELVSLAKESGLFRDILVCEQFDSAFTESVKKLSESDSAFNKDWHYPYQVVFYK